MFIQVNPLLFAVPVGISLPDDFGCNENAIATQETTDMSLDIWKCHPEYTLTVCMYINVGEPCLTFCVIISFYNTF